MSPAPRRRHRPPNEPPPPEKASADRPITETNSAAGHRITDIADPPVEESKTVVMIAAPRIARAAASARTK